MRFQPSYAPFGATPDADAERRRAMLIGNAIYLGSAVVLGALFFSALVTAGGAAIYFEEKDRR